MLDATVEGFELSEQLRAIQNDGLALYYDLTKNQASPGVTFSSFAPASYKVQNLNSKLPIFTRKPDEDASYINFETFKTVTTDNPAKLTNNNLNGVVLETFIEMTPNYSFVSNLQVKQKINNFFNYGGCYLVVQGQRCF